jgi:hypothetical protein
MDKPIVLCGQTFTPELVEHLTGLLTQSPNLSRNALAREVCVHLNWRSPNGRLCTASAKVALRKLDKRGLLSLPPAKAKRKSPHRLRPSGQALPPLLHVPGQVGQVRGLRLYLLGGHEDPLHSLWNDLMIQQHPCGDAPLVGAQLRYLIGSEHGWLGALGFGPAAFVLGARDQWIGWSTTARLRNLNQVLGLSRVLIRQEVRCANLLSKVLKLALARLPSDWEARYGVRPLLVETFVERQRYTGQSLSAANWSRIGASTGRGRLGPAQPQRSLKDIWVYPLERQARQKLQRQPAAVVKACSLLESLSGSDWCARELETLDLGDARLNRRAVAILEARLAQPEATFFGSFSDWAQAKGAYSLIEQSRADVNFERLLAPHREATLARMAAETVVLLPQDTTTLNYTGLRQTSGLGPLGENKARGLWMHSTLAFRQDGVPLGVLDAQIWARPEERVEEVRGRNAKSVDEKESGRWLQALGQAAEAARRLPHVQLISITDREGDTYEMHDQVQQAPPNLHTLIRAQHDRQLQSHQKLWDFMASQPSKKRRLRVPRHKGQPARTATVQIHWGCPVLEAPATGAKKSWPSLKLSAIWVHEINPPPGVEPLDWMLLTDLPVTNAAQAWEKVLWYCRRWGIEEWHRVLKSGCGAERREFKTAEHLQRVLLFDMIVAWRVLALTKIGRVLPQLPAAALYSEVELEVLWRGVKKNGTRAAPLDLARSQSTDGALGRLHGPLGRWRAGR